VLDGAAIWRQQQVAENERQEESSEARHGRVRHLAQLVKSGDYAVPSDRLASALLEWDPRRSNPKQAAEVADRRRSYMRDYMRKRRAHLTS